jgi:hypothetical protein
MFLQWSGDAIHPECAMEIADAPVIEGAVVHAAATF